MTGVHFAVANSQLALQSLAIGHGYRTGTKGGAFSVCDFTLPAVAEAGTKRDILVATVSMTLTHKPW